MHKPSDQNPILKAWYYYFPILFGLAYAQKAIFTENQNTKFITGLAYAAYGDIASDWMAKITDPFPFFTYLFKWTYQILGLHLGVHLLFLLLAGAYALFGVWIAKNLLETDTPQSKALWIFSFFWLFIHTEGLRQFWGHFFPDGLAYQYLMGEYFQPCCFGAFLLGGIGAYAAKRFIIAAFCFIIAPMFHPTYLFAALLVPLSLSLLPANHHMKIKWKKRILFLVITGAVLIPYGLWNVNTLTSGDPALREKAYEILTKTRIPHHALPSHWSFRLTLQFFIVGFLAAWSAKRHLIGQILMVLMSVAALSVGFASFFYNPTLAAIAPWRVSVLAAPLSWVVLLSKFSKWVSTKLQEKGQNTFKKFRNIAAGLAIIACLVGIVETYANYQDKTKRPDYAISKFMARYHNPGYLYLIPLNLKNLRLEAGVPVYVTSKSHPTRDVEFLSFHERTKIAKKLYDPSTPIDLHEIAETLADNGITHIVWPVDRGAFPYKKIGRKIYADKDYTLWDLRSAHNENPSKTID